jgi:prepilin-type N-terminal cleavage/methylation domain-containing protein/prepilin-type processing-associated H-X9-DG protein
MVNSSVIDLPGTTVSRERSASGFTLLELIVVLAVIALLVLLLLPAVQSSRESARRAQCLNNLHQIGIGLANYMSVHAMFPSGYVTEVQEGSEYGPGLGWGALILPFVDQAPLYNSFNISQWIQFPQSQTFRSVSLSMFLCPTSTNTGPVMYKQVAAGAGLFDVAAGQYVGSMGDCNYLFNPSDATGVLFRNSLIGPAQVNDGLSNTIVVGERSRNLVDSTWVGVVYLAEVCSPASWPAAQCAPATITVLAQTGTNDNDEFVETPNWISATPDDFWSLHAGGCNFLFGDSSARFIKQTITPVTFGALTTRAGGEVVSSGEY